MEDQVTESVVQDTPESAEQAVETTEQTTEATEQTTDKPSAPESYEDFVMPDGLTFDRESSNDFLASAKEMNLTQEQAQKFVDLYGSRIAAQQQQQQEQVESWANESKKMFKQADIDLANNTLSRFADKEVIELLANSGLGNHKSVIALFKNIGKQISEAQFVDSNNSTAGKSAAEILYPSMKK